MLQLDGQKVREVRRRRLLTIQELGEEADLAPAHLGVLERSGDRRVHMRTVRKLAKALDVDPNEIISPESPDGLGEMHSVAIAAAALASLAPGLV